MTNEELAIRIKAGIDTADNMLQLWEQTRRFIRRIASRYVGAAELEDLEQEGYLALYDAVDGYRPDLGCKFLTYAEYWIKQRLLQYARKNTPVYMPAHEWQRVLEYRKTVNAYSMYLNRKPSRREIADHMGLTAAQVAQLEKSAGMGQIRSLDTPYAEDEDTTLRDMIPADVDVEGMILDDAESVQLKKAIWSLVADLPDEQEKIIHMRYFLEKSVNDVAEHLGMTYNKAQRTERKALRNLRYCEKSDTLRAFLPDVVGSLAYAGGSQTFKQTWTSSTERVALKL